MSNTQVLPAKLTATATILLTLAMTLASAQTQSEKATFMALANSGVTGAYVPLAALANQLKAEAVAVKSWADRLHANGGDINMQSFVNSHKTQFLGSINSTQLQKDYKAAVAAGYKGDINDFSRVLKSATVTLRKAALTYMNQNGWYKVMVQAAENFAAAGAQAASLAAERKAHLITAAYHPTLYYYFVLPINSCRELLWAGALFAYSGLLLDGVGIGLAFGIIGIGIGVAYGYAC